jgi:hypothetical protein
MILLGARAERVPGAFLVIPEVIEVERTPITDLPGASCSGSLRGQRPN